MKYRILLDCSFVLSFLPNEKQLFLLLTLEGSIATAVLHTPKPAEQLYVCFKKLNKCVHLRK